MAFHDFFYFSDNMAVYWRWSWLWWLPDAYLVVVVCWFCWFKNADFWLLLMIFLNYGDFSYDVVIFLLVVGDSGGRK